MAIPLYTPQVLALAVELARWPLHSDLPLRAEARSPSCGSTLTVGLAVDGEGRITRIGIAAQACAVGQAAAAIMADAAVGRTAQQFVQAQEALALWLAGKGPLPDWPGLGAIAPARDYPARHGAVMLGWRAVLSALSTPVLRG